MASSTLASPPLIGIRMAWVENLEWHGGTVQRRIDSFYNQFSYIDASTVT